MRRVFENTDSQTIIGVANVHPASREIAERVGAPMVNLGIKGVADPEDFESGCSYRLIGYWTEYRGEKQFTFSSYVTYAPPDRDGMIAYLASAGQGNGIGPSRASQLVDEFGVETVLSDCRENPERVIEITRVQPAQVHSFLQRLIERQHTEQATLEVQQLLGKHGFPKTLTQRVIKRWKNRAAEVITDDPFLLMEFPGVGFKLTDRLYMSLGKDPAAIERQAMALWYVLYTERNGHTWIKAKDALIEAGKIIGAGLRPADAVNHGKQQFGPGGIRVIRTDDEGRIVEDGGTPWLATATNADDESNLARLVMDADSETEAMEIKAFHEVENTRELVPHYATCQRCNRKLTASNVYVHDRLGPHGPTCIDYVDPDRTETEVYTLEHWAAENPTVYKWIEEQPLEFRSLPEVSIWPEPSELIGVTKHQAEQAGRAMAGRIGILTGSPGTGKTYTVASIIKALLASGACGASSIGIGAPTGKAAVRLTESLRAQGVSMRARTWHSLLGVGEANEFGCSFEHGENNPWSYRVVIGDEWSMPDSAIARCVFAARQRGTHFLMIGDTNQLPPVGSGAPFRDLIESGLPNGELVEIQRNAGAIVEACARIRDGENWADLCDTWNGSDCETNLMFTESPSAESQVADILRILEHEQEARGLDPVWDNQILVAVNEKSKVSRVELNRLLQDELSDFSTEDHTHFRNADKVVCLKNGYYRCLNAEELNPAEVVFNDSGEAYVANGEIGRIVEVRDKTLLIMVEGKLLQIPLIRESKDAATAKNWDLAYAVSCHKFQGSEGKSILTVLDDYTGAKMVCDRSWLYTAISRARDRQYLVGKRCTAEAMCRAQKIGKRQTMLPKLITKLRVEREFAAL